MADPGKFIDMGKISNLIIQRRIDLWYNYHMEIIDRKIELKTKGTGDLDKQTSYLRAPYRLSPNRAPIKAYKSTHWG